MKTPWDATAEGIYNPHEDPIAVDDDERAAYHKVVQAELAESMEAQYRAEAQYYETVAKHYNDAIWPKVKVVKDMVAKTKTKIAMAKARANLANAKAKASLAEAELATAEVSSELDENTFLRSGAVTITKAALNKVHTIVAETDIAIANADDALVKANADLAKTIKKIRTSEQFLVRAEDLAAEFTYEESLFLDELGEDFLFLAENTKTRLVRAKVTSAAITSMSSRGAKTNLVKAKIALTKAKTTRAKTTVNIVKTSAKAVVIEARHGAEALVNRAKFEVAEAEKSECSFTAPQQLASAKDALAKTETQTKAAVTKVKAEAQTKIELANAKAKVKSKVAKARLAEDLLIEAKTEAEVKADLANANLTTAKTDLANAKDSTEKTKAEASVTKAKADLILVEAEVALARTKANEAEAIANLAKAILIEVNSIKKDLGVEDRKRAQIEVDIAEAALDKAKDARIKTKDDVAKAKADLAAATTLADQAQAQTGEQVGQLDVPLELP